MNQLVPYLPIVFVALLLFRRTQRSRRIYVSWLWTAPAVFLLLIALYVYAAVRAHAHLSLVDVAVVACAAAAGGILGMVRAQTLTLVRHADTGAIEAKLSMWGLAFLLGWLLLRTVLRENGFVHASENFGVFNSAMLALLFASVVARAIILHRRCASLPPVSSDASTDASTNGSAEIAA